MIARSPRVVAALMINGGNGLEGCVDKRTNVSHLVVKFHNLYSCRLVRLTPYACSPVIDGSVLTVVVRECIVIFG